jgi:hypothetical protein
MVGHGIWNLLVGHLHCKSWVKLQADAQELKSGSHTKTREPTICAGLPLSGDGYSFTIFLPVWADEHDIGTPEWVKPAGEGQARL